MEIYRFMNKIILIAIAVAVIVGGGAFYGGMQYQKSKSPSSDFQNLSNLSPEERQQRFQQMGIPGGSRGGNQNGGGFATGEIISKDDKSVTVKLRDGGSKIVFFSDSTEISKFISGTQNDLEIGKTITVNGKTNQDGSITAQTIQFRPLNSPQPSSNAQQ